MMNIAGAVLIVAALWGLGLNRGAELRARSRLLSALVSALELTRSEIVDRLTPVPEIAARLAERGPAETREFFALLLLELDGLGQRSFGEIWESCLGALALREGERATLTDLGLALGRCGGEEQGAAIGRCMDVLSSAAARAAAEAVSGGKLSAGLGLTAGLLLAVTLV